MQAAHVWTWKLDLIDLAPSRYCGLAISRAGTGGALPQIGQARRVGESDDDYNLHLSRKAHDTYDSSFQGQRQFLTALAIETVLMIAPCS